MGLVSRENLFDPIYYLAGKLLPLYELPLFLSLTDVYKYVGTALLSVIVVSYLVIFGDDS